MAFIDKEEKHNLRVCERCLMAIESREGTQAILKHYIDTDEEPGFCEWCDEDGFDVLYELI